MLRITLVMILIMVSFVAMSLGQENEAPKDITGPASYTILEGPGTTTKSGNYSATDPENDANDAIVWSVSGTGFSINQSGRLTFTVTDPDYETTPIYEGDITATDIHGAPSPAYVVTVNIVNQPEPGKITFSLSESGDDLTAILTDPDITPADESVINVNWSWSGYSSDIDPTGDTYMPVAADAGNTLSVTATYTDAAGGDSATGTYTVGVGSGASPRFSDTTATATVNENTATPHLVGTYTATGGTGTLAYTLSALTNGFSINSSTGALTLTAATLEYEVNIPDDRTYTAVIIATDEENQTGEITVIVTLNNVDEDGMVSFNPPTAMVETEVTASVTDPDMVTTDNTDNKVTGPITWRWSAIAGEDPGDSDKYSPVADDAGNTLSVTAEYYDGVGRGNDTATGTLSVPAAANAAPVVSGPTTVEVWELSTSLSISYSATDEDDDTLTYAVTGAARESNAGHFSMDLETGVLTYSHSDPFDYEVISSYDLIVKANDGTADSADFELTVTVLNVAEPGSISFMLNGQMLTAKLTDEDMVPSDEDMVPSVVWWDWLGISGNVPDRRGTRASNYDLHGDDMDMTVLEVTATYTDAAGNDSATATYTIGTDPNPGPKFSSEEVTVQVNENTPTPYVVDTYAATGGTGTLGYTLSASTSTTSFSINPSTGALTLTASPLEYEVNSPADRTYRAVIIATDEEDQTGEITVTVTLNNVDEPGSITFSPARVVAVEGETVSTLTATLTDDDGAGAVSLGTVTWRWEGISGSHPPQTSTTDNESAESAYTQVADDIAGTTLRVTATYRDAAGTREDSATATVKVLATPLIDNTPPVVRTTSGNTSYSLPENSPISIGLSASDPDDVDLMWSLGDAGDAGDENLFELASARGQDKHAKILKHTGF